MSQNDTPDQQANATDGITVALQTLNEAYAADPGALHALICNRVPCNTALAEHPSIQVSTNSVTQPEIYAVGMLGIINGILERATGQRVAAKFSDGKQPVLLGFVEYAPAPTERSSVTPAKHHDPRLTQAKVCLETRGLRRGAYIVTDNHYLTKLGTWTFDIRDENNWWPDLDSAKAFLLKLRKQPISRPSLTVSK